jgi:hypothetical protein
MFIFLTNIVYVMSAVLIIIVTLLQLLFGVFIFKKYFQHKYDMIIFTSFWTISISIMCIITTILSHSYIIKG